MRRWMVVGAVLTAALMSSVMMAPRPAVADDAAAPPAVKAEAAPGTSVDFYRSDADSTRLISVVSNTDGTVRIDGDKRFIATGVFDDKGGIIGVYRMTATSPGERTRRGVLRFHPLGRLAKVEFASDGKPTARETWTRLQVARRSSEPAGLAGAPDNAEFFYVDEIPQVVDQVQPDYPSWAKARGISGTVAIQALIGADGAVEDTRVIESIPDLDDYALGAVKHWHFKPAMSMGKPLSVWVSVPVTFSLR